MDKVMLLSELRSLVSSDPYLATYNPSSRPHTEWLGKAHALIKRWDEYEAITFKMATDSLGNHFGRDTSIATIMNMLNRAIADLEFEVGALPAQAFGPGAVYDFMKSLRELLSSATKSLFIIDPYLDDQVFDAYLSTVTRTASVRLLIRKTAPSLKSTMTAFSTQTGMSVEVRTSKSIHDRVIFLDDSSCWVLGQSIKDAAKSKPTYLAPLTEDLAQLKRDVYDNIWTTATPI